MKNPIHGDAAPSPRFNSTPRRGRRSSIYWLAALVCATLTQASTVIPAPRQQKPILLRGGTVVPINGAELERGDVLLIDGKIAQVGATLTAPAGAEVIDVKGKRVYPGLIAAVTHLGLVEITGARQTNDTAEIGLLNPNARAQTAINPESEHIPVARLNGILTALSLPSERAVTGGRASLIGGTSTLLRLDGWTWEDLTLQPMVAMHVFWPSMKFNRTAQSTISPVIQQRGIDTQIRALDDAFTAARAYARTRTAGVIADTDLRWEAMLPVLRGELPVFVHADDMKQIRAALAFAQRQGLKITIVGGLDAWRVADELKAADVPVIIAGVNRLPDRRDDDYEAAYANAARLYTAGVRFCIANRTAIGSSSGNDRNLPYEAARAAAHGLPRDVALRSITLSAAEILGVAKELGSIEVGKRATLIVTDGDPLEISTQVKLAFIDGAKIDLISRHTQLYDKYRERLRRVQEGRPATAAGSQ
jgi:imidazolonepropionase-like amidohydrolase